MWPPPPPAGSGRAIHVIWALWAPWLRRCPDTEPTSHGPGAPRLATEHHRTPESPGAAQWEGTRDRPAAISGLGDGALANVSSYSAILATPPVGF
ncbi:hypothetical protein NDU88_007159 [Pleurodeles waltl]|uniref:Secreted protein n=1 Tax=Pleurodeles waltl TaxID=8319 RepID=A0AAV7SRI4_PLEWA|nr:hypothetical protein NDU88_007159 [Pleurodeles waltl]